MPKGPLRTGQALCYALFGRELKLLPFARSHINGVSVGHELAPAAAITRSKVPAAGAELPVLHFLEHLLFRFHLLNLLSKEQSVNN